MLRAPALTLVLMLAGCGSSTAAPPQPTAGTEPAARAATPPAPSPPSPGTISTTPGRSTTSALAPLSVDQSRMRREGYTPSGRQVGVPGGGQELYAFLGICTGSADGHCQEVFFFLDTRYLGTDTSAPSGEIMGLAPGGPATVTVTYAGYRMADPECCPSGPSVTVRYHWTGGRLVRSGTPPRYR